MAEADELAAANTLIYAVEKFIEAQIPSPARRAEALAAAEILYELVAAGLAAKHYKSDDVVI